MMLKKIAKVLDEMARNEDLMASILKVAEGDEDYEMGEMGEERLNTIGEDGDEEKQLETKQESSMPAIAKNPNDYDKGA